VIQISGWTHSRYPCHQATMRTPISQSWHWQAIDPSRNVARAYHLWIQTDLLVTSVNEV